MPNIYFLYGNDEFAIARKLKDFDSDFSDPTSADMNTARLEARSMSEDDLGNAVNAMVPGLFYEHSTFDFLLDKFTICCELHFYFDLLETFVVSQ